MICSCPVVCSNTSSIPEVAGDAAIYFDPRKVSSIASAIKNLLNDKDLRSKSIKQGLAQATKFSWDKCAKETERVYQKAITQ
jgi:glycosyltransferase involved in cell wall biosynthesis